MYVGMFSNYPVFLQIFSLAPYPAIPSVKGKKPLLQISDILSSLSIVLFVTQSREVEAL